MTEAQGSGRGTLPHHLVTLEDGTELRLRFQVTAVRDAQRVSGKSFGALLGATLAFDVEAAHVLLWAALKYQAPKTSLNAAADTLQDLINAGHDLERIAGYLATTAKLSGFIAADRDDIVGRAAGNTPGGGEEDEEAAAAAGILGNA